MCVYAVNSPHLLLPQAVQQVGAAGPKNILWQQQTKKKAKHDTEMKNRDLVKKTGGAMVFTETATLVAFVEKV